MQPSDAHAQAMREATEGFTFGLPKVADSGADCCGKPAGCTNPSCGCLFRNHPLKRDHLAASQAQD